jgi:hypothetical protein
VLATALAPLGCTGSLEGGPGLGGQTTRASLPAASGLRTLTPAQYEASVRDVLGLEPDGRDGAPIAPLGQWSTAIAAARGGFSPTTVESYEAGARDAAAWVVADPARRAELVGCTPTAVAADPCAAEFLARVGRRAYRRALEADEVARWTALAATIGQALGDPWRGLEHALSGILQSPHFLYRVELGEDDPQSADAAALRYSSHEMATRLSYLVWGTTPDEELLDAAERGELTTDEGLDAQLERMLRDPRADAGLAAFVADLLEVDGLRTVEKDGTLHPDFEAQREPMRAQLVQTATVALAGGGFGALFTTRSYFVDRTTAPLLGLDASAFGDTPTRVELPADGPRAGVLTTPGFLAMHSYAGKTSPALRGLYVRRRVLCHDIPPPPPGVATILPERADGALVTTRELVSFHQEEEVCAACHRYMDPIGLGLEQFDEIGAHRLTQNELPIDPSGDLDGTAFDDARGLGEAIADHPALAPCMASRLFAFGAGSTVSADERAVRRLAAGGDDVRAMLTALVRSELFRRARAADEATGGGL